MIFSWQRKQIRFTNQKCVTSNEEVAIGMTWLRVWCGNWQKKQRSKFPTRTGTWVSNEVSTSQHDWWQCVDTCNECPKNFTPSVCDSNKSVQRTLEQRFSRVFFSYKAMNFTSASVFCFLFLQRINVISSRLPLCNEELVQKHSRSDPLIKCDRTLVVLVVVVTFELISSCCALRFELIKKTAPFS